MPSKGGMQSEIPLKENGLEPFNSKVNVNTFDRFFSNIVDSLLQKLPHPKNKFGIKTTEEYYEHIRNKCEDFVLHNVDVTTVDKILNNLRCWQGLWNRSDLYQCSSNSYSSP